VPLVSIGVGVDVILSKPQPKDFDWLKFVYFCLGSLLVNFNFILPTTTWT
jgi:hypothetical protein